MIGGSDGVKRVDRRKGRRKVELGAIMEVLEEGNVLCDDTSGGLGKMDTLANDEVEAGGERSGGGGIKEAGKN